MPPSCRRRAQLPSDLLVRLIAVAVVAIGATPAASAVAAVQPPWIPVTTANTENIEEVSAARTADGNLHVVWLRPDAANTANEDLMATTISPAGAVGPAQPVVSNWGAINQPALVTAPDGSLRVFFGGIRSTDPTDPQDGLESATAPAAGAPWTLTAGNASVTNSSYSGDASAAFAADGTPLMTWAGTAGVFIHRGLDPAATEFEYEAALGGCCGYDPNLALDGASEQLWLAWFSNATGKDGVWVQGVAPASGGPIGGPMLMPGSQTAAGGATNADPTGYRTSIVGRPGLAGVFVGYPGGYPTHTSALVWRIGTPSPTVLAQGSGGHEHVVLAAAPGGRLWALWSEQRGGRAVIVARRSNPQVTAWGAESVVAAPSGTMSTYALSAAGPPSALGPLDALGSFATGGGLATYHTLIVPALGISVSGSVSRRKGGKLTVTATDALTPLKGVHVVVGGHAASTSATGRATLAIGPTGASTLTLVASDGGYVNASVTVVTKH